MMTIEELTKAAFEARMTLAAAENHLLIARWDVIKERLRSANQEMTRDHLVAAIKRHRDEGEAIRREQGRARIEVERIRQWAKDGHYAVKAELVAERREAEIAFAIANADARIVAELVAGAKRELEYWDYMERDEAATSLMAMIDEIKSARLFYFAGMSGYWWNLTKKYEDEAERREDMHRLLRSSGIKIVIRDFERQIMIMREVGKSAVMDGAL